MADQEVKVFDPEAVKEFQERRDRPPKPAPKPLKERIKEKVAVAREKVHIGARYVGRKGVEFARFTGRQVKIGLKEGARETVRGYGEAIRTGARHITAAPYRVPRAIIRRTLIPRARAARAGYYRAGMPGIRYRGVPSGRIPRAAIPRGTIKPYWSKKLKKLARQQIRRHGVEEGLSRTREAARLLNWKMQ